jgi:ABC-type multidrug transport system ATPase subunit
VATVTDPILRVEGAGVTLEGGRRILAPLTLDIAPGRFVAVLGASGSGKTTLVRAMAGITEPTEGRVTVDGAPALERAGELGYVPQRETLHDRLTVEEALRFGALLRLEDARDAGAAVAEALAELDLERAADTRVRDLSGGERRRAACGVELAGRPRVLLLDEPTSGLDPVLERRLMTTFRRLADQGRAVVVVTHATASLDLCDEVLVLADGAVAFRGAPAGALAHLAPPAGARPSGGAPAAAVPPARRLERARPLGFELRVLAGRYARTLWRDRRTLALLVGQAPVIGLLIAVLFDPGVLSRPDEQPGSSVQLVFLLMTGAIWLGITSGCREIVKERGIVEREFDVGVRLDAYVLAKAAVLFALGAVQALLLCLVVLGLQRPEEPAAAVAGLVGLTILVTWVAAAFGLAVSAVARSVDQAAGAVPLLLVPQLLFAGAIVPLERMSAPVRALADLTFARWALDGMGHTLALDARLAEEGRAAAALGYGTATFGLDAALCTVVLLAFALGFLVLAALLLNGRVQADAGP